MPKRIWIAGLTGAALLAAAGLAAAEQPVMAHDMHSAMDHGAGTTMPAAPARLPTMPGQEVFGTIQEIVALLEADPKTDWSKVDIAALREHLIDMNEVALHAVARERAVGDTIEISVTGTGRTLAGIRRMVPAHARELARIGWKTRTEPLPDGVKLVVTATDRHPLVKLKALGFMGIMVQDAHHQRHHLMMAQGEMAVH